MGYLTSATTIYARAYLTGRGREYLFNNSNIRFNSTGTDLFRVTTFTLGDPDVNYNTSQVLPEGAVPDVSGKYDTCLKTALDYEQRNLLFFQNFDQLIANNVDYATDANANILNVNVNLNDNDLPTGTDGAIPAPTGNGPNNTFPTIESGTRGATTGGGRSSASSPIQTIAGNGGISNQPNSSGPKQR